MSGEDLGGRLITEEELAKHLGFSNVDELRRWDTEMGKKVSTLEQQLYQANRDKDNFLWQGQRMQKVLEKLVEPLLDQVNQSYLPPKDEIAQTLKALKVVCNKEADCGGEIRKLLEKL